MHNKLKTFSLLATSVALLAAVSVFAQVEKTPMDPKSLTPPGEGKRLGIMPANAPKPSPDPRNLQGIYMNKPEPMPAGGPPGGMGGGPGPVPGGGAPVQPEFPICTPDMTIGAGAYAMKIFQTPGRVTFLTEDGHIVRNVFLDGNFPAKIEPRHIGTSIGHWEGDTLVIETRGVKPGSMAARGLASITRVMERVRKIEGGQVVEDIATIEGVDAAGQAATRSARANLMWRPDLMFLEYICEDTEGLFFSK